MATDRDFVDYIVTQSGLEQRLTYKRMFGEYALYLEGRVVAFACDNQLFLKPTPEGRSLIEHVTEGQPYPGSKMYLKIDDELDNRDQLRRLLLKTAEVLPLPPPKKPRQRKAASGRSVAKKAASGKRVAAKKAVAREAAAPSAPAKRPAASKSTARR